MADWSAYVLPLALVFAAGTAHARSPENPGDDGPAGAHVSINAPEHPASLQIVPVGESQPVAQCENYCDFWALPGRYTLYTEDHDTGARHELGLRIKHSVRYSLNEGDDNARDAGLAVGITGAASIVVGLIMTAPLILSAMCEGDCTTNGERTAAEIGLGMMLGGAIATPIGFSVYSHNRTKLMPMVESGYGKSDSGPSVRVGVVGVSGGLGLGGVAVF